MWARGQCLGSALLHMPAAATLQAVACMHACPQLTELNAMSARFRPQQQQQQQWQLQQRQPLTCPGTDSHDHSICAHSSHTPVQCPSSAEFAQHCCDSSKQQNALVGREGVRVHRVGEGVKIIMLPPVPPLRWYAQLSSSEP